MAGSSRLLAGTDSALYDDSIITQFANTYYLANTAEWLLQSQHCSSSRDLAIFMKNVCYLLIACQSTASVNSLSPFMNILEPVFENHPCTK